MKRIVIAVSFLFVFFAVPAGAAYSLQSIFFQERIMFLDMKAPNEKFVQSANRFTEGDRSFAKKKFIESTNKATATLIRLEAILDRLEQVRNSDEDRALIKQARTDIEEARLDRDRMIRAFENVFASENPPETYREIRSTHEAAFLEHIRDAFLYIEKLSGGDINV